MKRSGFTLWELIGIVALIVVVAAIVWPMFARPRNPGRTSSCPNNLKQIGIALAQYCQDYDEQLPRIIGTAKPTAAKPYGWVEALQPYLKSWQTFHCPSASRRKMGSSRGADAAGYTDYWFNSNLSGFDFNKRKTGMAEKTIAFGDGNDGADLTDARYNLPSLPAAWISNQSSPAYRHDGGANYAFVDGHVKHLTPDDIAAGPATFAPK